MYCFVLLLLVSDMTVADVASMWASLYKQASICQRYASILKVLFFFAPVFLYFCYYISVLKPGWLQVLILTAVVYGAPVYQEKT